jgi:very-short-patch-repair endonuclease
MSSELENKFLNLWGSLCNIPLIEEYRFSSKRRFRFDFAHRESKVAIEINGGIFIKSGHSSSSGLSRDYEKLNLAQLEDWQVYQLSSKMINESNLKLIQQKIEERCNCSQSSPMFFSSIR